MKASTLKDVINGNNWSASKAAILNQLIENGSQTISELSNSLGVSIPHTTKSLNELIEIGVVRVIGKRDNCSRRAPRVYDLIPSSGYFLGIDTGYDTLNLGISDFCGNLISSRFKIPFHYEDNKACFNKLIDIINTYVEKSEIDKELIQNTCLGVGGRVNPEEGKAHNYFTCLNKPLAEALSEKIGIPACIDNDTRCMTYGEYLKGCCKGVKNVIFVNVSWGIGIGIIIDGKLYSGKSGYSGEIGHMHIYNNGIICHCGKTGCMETETSGSALQRKMQKLLSEGGTSILSDSVVNKKEELTLQAILNAIAKEDVLSIEALQKVAAELGNNLAGVINIFNPEMIVIGGDLSVTGDYLTQPIRMGIKKFSLNMVNEDSQIVTSNLTDKAGLIGACLMARSKMLPTTSGIK